MILEHETWVAVCDGGKFLLLQNRGDTDYLDLHVIAHEKLDIQAGPGRESRGPSPDGTRARVGRAQSQSVEDIAEFRFVHSIADELDGKVQSGSIRKMVLVADPKTLGQLRAHINERTRDAICEEIVGDFAHETVADVEALLNRHERTRSD
ncbi:MAG: baeRF12 domain-containing protein [Henriciella sp.]